MNAIEYVAQVQIATEEAANEPKCMDCHRPFGCGHIHLFCDACATKRHGVASIPCKPRRSN